MIRSKAYMAKQTLEVGKILESCSVGSLLNSWWGKEILKHASSPELGFPPEIVVKAAAWPTCACGQLSDNLKRGSTGKPIDHKLSNSGVSFFVSVRNGWTLSAARYLVQIEERAHAILVKGTQL